MEQVHLDALADALVAARHDHADAMSRLLTVVLEMTGASEVRLVLLDGPGLETWSLPRGHKHASLAISLDSAAGHGSWRTEVERAQSREVVLTPLPRAPGIDAGVLTVDVPQREDIRHRVSERLRQVALHASCIASAARTDLERRIAVDAALELTSAGPID